MFSNLRSYLLLLVVVGLLAGACTADQPPDREDNPATDHPATNEPATDNPATDQPAPSPEALPTVPADPRDQALAYARCVRDNGYPEWPDPNADGQFMIRRDQGHSFNDPRRVAAMEACQALRPAGAGGMGLGGGAQMGAMDEEQLLEFARCMRANGVAAFPDPGVGGGPMIIGPDTGIDPNSPTFRQAVETCFAAINP